MKSTVPSFVDAIRLLLHRYIQHQRTFRFGKLSRMYRNLISFFARFLQTYSTRRTRCPIMGSRSKISEEHPATLSQSRGVAASVVRRHCISRDPTASSSVC